MNNESIESVTTTAGLLGATVLFALALACWLLFRSMSRHLRTIRNQAQAQQEASAAGAGAAARSADRRGDPSPGGS